MLTYMELMQKVAGNRTLVATTDAGMYVLSSAAVRGWKFQFSFGGTAYAAFWHGANSSTQMGCFTVEWEDAEGEMHGAEYWPHGAVVQLV